MIVGHIGAGGDSGIDTGDIEHSLRFSRAQYASRTPSVAGNRKTWTWSGLVKRAKVGSYQAIFQTTGANSDSTYFRVAFGVVGKDEIHISNYSSTVRRATTARYIDISAHYHIVVALDTTLATAQDRLRLWVNGAQVTTFDYQNDPALDADLGVNLNQTHHIGVADSGLGYLDGYLSRVCFIDGQALTPDSFGYLNTEINEWVSKSQSQVKAVVDAGGTNSFMLDFDDGSSLTTLGYDKSVKGNNWTLNGFSLTPGVNYDWVEDVPGNSYATLNPLVVGHSTLTNGNLTASGVGDLPTIIPSGGTWYFERGGVAQTWTPPAAFPSASGDYNFGQRPFVNTPPHPTLCQANLDAAGTVVVSGTFTGNASADGPFVWMNGSPNTLSINGNAVTFGTHANRLANGFKVRTNSASYNAAGSNTWMATISSDLQNIFKYNNAKDNP